LRVGALAQRAEEQVRSVLEAEAEPEAPGSFGAGGVS